MILNEPDNFAQINSIVLMQYKYKMKIKNINENVAPCVHSPRLRDIIKKLGRGQFKHT